LISTSINLSSQHTEGADLEANYSTTVLNRPASFRVLTTYQPKILYVQPGLLTLNQAGAAFGNNGITAAPIYRVTATARFQPLQNLTFDFQWRWRSKLHEAGDPTLVFSCCEIGTANFTNFAATYALKEAPGQPEVSFNVTNLFNQRGPHASPFTNTNPGQQYGYVVYDDPLGRAYTIGLRMRF
jgi:outer membrane receptor for ferrienterochelin and colicin